MGPDSVREPDSLWDTAFQFNPANLVAALIVAFLVAALSVTIVLTRPAKYQSTATLAVDQPALVATGGAGELDKLSKIRLKYAPLVKTDVIAKPLAQELGTTPAVIRSSVSAVAPGDNILVVITARSANKADAQRFASATAAYLAKYVEDEQTHDAVPANQQFEFTVVDEARPATKADPSRTRAIAVGLAAGLIALALTYVALQLLRPRREPDAVT